MNTKKLFALFTNFLRRSDPKRLLVLFLGTVAFLGVGGSYYFYSKYQQTKVDPNSEARKETEALVAIVGRLIELPKDETPTVATVLDKEKLKNQAFFRLAENGDKLLVYNAAMTAILYRPSINKIINVAPITINQPQTTAQNTQSAPAVLVPRIAYYNGTQTAGLAGLVEKAVLKKYPNYQTSGVSNANKKDYKQTVVVDVTGKYTKEASDIATLLGGVVGSLPQGEVSPDADILVISGK